jgi:PAS domain S-box-containing protein
MGTGTRINYSELVDVAKLQSLLESFNKVIGIANAVIDVDGRVIAQAGWQVACAEFHRGNPETCRRCIESDTSLARSMTQGATYTVYECLNGLVDTASPIMVEGQHVANVFTGQFLTKEADREFFLGQARKFGFDEAKYMDAISRVPVVSREKVEAITRLYAQLAATLADNGVDRLRQRQAAEDLVRFNQELEERVAVRTRELTDSEARFRTIIEASPVPMVLTGDLGDISYVNAAFTRTFGYVLSDIPTVADWWPKAYPDEQYREWVATTWQAHVEKAKCDGVRFEPIEAVVQCKDGSTRTVLGEASPLGDSFGETYLATLYDITERKEAEAKIRRFSAELEQSVKERTHDLQVTNSELESFAYSVSHDLRAPLRAIEGFSSLLETEYAATLDDRARNYFKRIRGGATRMGVLIDDLLNLSRLSRQEMRRGPVDLSALAREVAEELKRTEPTRRVEWVIAPQATATGDLGLLRVVMQNLIGNAWKYSSRREVSRIEFGICEHGGSPAFFVRDNGEGFDMAYADKLFGAFQRLHSPAEFPGTGIGLATVKRIIHRHGGEVAAQARINEGATFYFTL